MRSHSMRTTYGGRTRNFSGKVGASMAGEEEGDSRLAGIRGFSAEDIPELISIAEGSSESASWSRESYEKLCGLEGFLAFVNEAEGCISGFVVGRQVVDEAEILNLAV